MTQALPITRDGAGVDLEAACRRAPAGHPSSGPGAGVVLEAEHSCMTLRGVRAHGAKTVTSALLGTLRADPRSRASSSRWLAYHTEHELPARAEGIATWLIR